MMNILGAPTNLGNRPYESDGTARWTHLAAARLRQHNVVERLHARDLGDVHADAYRDFVRPPGGVRNEELVLEHVLALASRLEETRDFTLVLGGDCSTLLGCLHGLRRHEPSLVFIDAHSDFNTPQISETGGVAGMDLALATGRGDTPLARLGNPLVRDEHVVTVGIREGEVGPLRTATNAEEVLAAIGDRPFFIHVDADVLDPRYLPFVDSPTPGGWSPHELTALLEPLVHHRNAIGMELTIYDPRDDRDGRGAELLVKILEAGLSGRPDTMKG